MTTTSKEIGLRIRALREDSNVTAEHLANHLNLTIRQYIEYENGSSEIPASMINEIAKKLNVDTGLILTGERPRMARFSVTRKGQGSGVSRRADYGYKNLVANFQNVKFQPFIVTIPVTDAKAPIPANSHSGQEFNYVLEGKIKIKIDNNEIELDTGDSIIFDAACSHGMKSLNGKEAKLLVIITI